MASACSGSGKLPMPGVRGYASPAGFPPQSREPKEVGQAGGKVEGKQTSSSVGCPLSTCLPPDGRPKPPSPEPVPSTSGGPKPVLPRPVRVCHLGPELYMPYVVQPLSCLI